MTTAGRTPVQSRAELGRLAGGQDQVAAAGLRGRLGRFGAARDEHADEVIDGWDDLGAPGPRRASRLTDGTTGR
ncbi:hypothetical protein ACIOD2_45050 [Amycolatopsis sp. NPDC088138]|uniref:hypothetical protein n=1 Tax=Amycolatopsis sp. NPDC088138 TaxID=3363938 RepID=UPI0037F35451